MDRYASSLSSSPNVDAVDVDARPAREPWDPESPSPLVRCRRELALELRRCSVEGGSDDALFHVPAEAKAVAEPWARTNTVEPGSTLKLTAPRPWTVA